MTDNRSSSQEGDASSLSVSAPPAHELAGLCGGLVVCVRNADTGKCFTGRRFESCHKTGAYFTLIVPPGTDYIK